MVEWTSIIGLCVVLFLGFNQSVGSIIKILNVCHILVYI